MSGSPTAGSWTRGSFAIARRTAWAAAAPLAITFAVCAVLGWSDTAAARADSVSMTDSTVLDSFWIHATASLGMVVALASAVRAWPGFGARRAEANGLARLRVGPINGCLAAAVGALIAWILGLATWIVLMAAFAGPAFSPPRAAAHVQMQCTPEMLTPSEPTAELRTMGAAPTDLARIRVRPRLMSSLDALENGFDVRLVDAAGRELGRARFHSSDTPASFDLDPEQPVHLPLRLEREAAEHEPLRGAVWLPIGRVEAVRGGARSGIANSLLAQVSWMVATLLALATACAARRIVGPAVLVLAASAVGLFSTLTGLVGVHGSLEAVATGRWLPSEGLLLDLWRPTVVALLLFGWAAWSDRRHRGRRMPAGAGARA